MSHRMFLRNRTRQIFAHGTFSSMTLRRPVVSTRNGPSFCRMIYRRHLLLATANPLPASPTRPIESVKFSLILPRILSHHIYLENK